MGYSLEPENREFIRINVELPVEYKFLKERKDHPDLGVTLHGRTSNLSGGGLLLNGSLPSAEWIPNLLMQRIVVGVKIQIPGSERTVLALCRVAWLEGAKEGAKKNEEVRFGLKFREISLRDRDSIFDFIIQDQMP